MKCRTIPTTGARKLRAAFTLAEVLAALVFMAIVIPVAIEGLRIANITGLIARRKAVAVRIAERILNETTLTSQTTANVQSGSVQEGDLEFRWTTKMESWTGDLQNPMRLLTVQVTYPVQGRDREVKLSTLIGGTGQ
jgi:type II secretory pathway pseudopilin PulG